MLHGIFKLLSTIVEITEVLQTERAMAEFAKSTIVEITEVLQTECLWTALLLSTIVEITEVLQTLRQQKTAEDLR